MNTNFYTIFWGIDILKFRIHCLCTDGKSDKIKTAFTVKDTCNIFFFFYPGTDGKITVFSKS